MAENVQQAQREMTDERDAAKAAAYQAVMLMADKLREAIGEGNRLYGLPNLGSGSFKYHAARLRGSWIDRPLEVPRSEDDWGAETICLNRHCELVHAQRDALGQVRERPVRPEDVMAEDTPRMVSTMQEVIKAHLKTIEKRSARYAQLRDLSRRMSEVLSR